MHKFVQTSEEPRWYAQVCANLNSDSVSPPTHIPEIGVDGKEIKIDRKVCMVPNPKFEDWDVIDQ
jgi:hypothetical protein